MNPIDPELLSLTNELCKLGGSRKVKLSRISVFIRGINNELSPINNVNFISFIEENNQIIIRHPSSANDMRCYDISKYFGPTISNDRVSADMVNRITTSIFDGFNVNLICYGSTNTGKSQLLFGSSADNMQYDSLEGLFGTLSANIFRKIDQTNDNISLSISFWEIGQNKVIDLLQNNKNNKIQSPFDIISVTISNWNEICSVWDIARYNSLNWNILNTGYQILPNESNLFIQIKIYNQTQQRVTTLNLIDLIGSHHMIRPLRPHISRDKIEENKEKNMNLFCLNKLLHHLCNLHLQQNQDKDKNKNKNKDLVQNVITESILNNFIGPMITQNAETIFLGSISCHTSDYQSSLRTIQVLSRTLSIKVPCIHTALNKHKLNQLSIISFQQFLSKWQSILYKHMMIENSIKQQMNQYNNDNNDNLNNSQSPIHPNNITQAIDNFNLSNLSIDDHQLNTQYLDDQLQELRKNIPQNVFINKSNDNHNDNGSNKEINNEISLLLDDILLNKNEKKENQDLFLKSKDFEEMMKITNKNNENELKTQSKDDEEIDLNEIESKQEDKTMAYIEFTNLRLENLKLKEEIRKLKMSSKYSSIFEDYDREIIILNKLIESMSNDNKLLSIKNMQYKQDINNYKLNGNKTEKNELKTVRILQKSLRETTKKLKETEISLTTLTSNIRHIDIRNRVLTTSKDEWYAMSELLNKRENELGASYLHQAETQANCDKLQLQITELQHENNTLQIQTKSLENEVSTLRHICKKINDDIKQRNQLHRVSKKWATKR